MLGNLNGFHAIIILVVVLLLFGAPRIPALAKSLGQSLKIFKTEVKPDAAPVESETTPASDRV
jgi:sec-independent protein translocase protein TatA